MTVSCPECDAILNVGEKKPGLEGIKLTCTNCGASLVYSLKEDRPYLERVPEKIEPEGPVETFWDLRPGGASIIRKKKSRHE